MNSIDNFEQLRDHIIIDSEDDFYFLQILQRKKDNPEIGSNSRVINTYFITSKEHYDKIKTEVIALCEVFNARASLRLNKRSWRKTAFKSLQVIANQMANGDFRHVKNAFTRSAGLAHNDKIKKWIIDIDFDGEGQPTEYDRVVKKETALDMLDFMNQCMQMGKKFVALVESKTGYHLIVTSFNLQEFKTKWPREMPDIHKDNPTNLYIP